MIFLATKFPVMSNSSKGTKTLFKRLLKGAVYLPVADLVYEYQRERRGVFVEWKLGFDAGVFCGCLNVYAYGFF
jgi:coproporphyrinogen III oxidase